MERILCFRLIKEKIHRGKLSTVVVSGRTGILYRYSYGRDTDLLSQSLTRNVSVRPTDQSDIRALTLIVSCAYLSLTYKHNNGEVGYGRKLVKI